MAVLSLSLIHTQKYKYFMLLDKVHYIYKKRSSYFLKHSRQNNRSACYQSYWKKKAEIRQICIEDKTAWYNFMTCQNTVHMFYTVTSFYAWNLYITQKAQVSRANAKCYGNLTWLHFMQTMWHIRRLFFEGEMIDWPVCLHAIKLYTKTVDHKYTKRLY